MVPLMDPVRRLFRPTLRSPRALVAWEGWNDAADAASGAAAFFLGQFEDIEPFATIEPEEFYDFQVRRPLVEISEGGTRRLDWPTTRAYAVEMDAGVHDGIVVTGEEPNLRWKTYTRSICRLLADSDAEMVVTLGAFIGQVAHTRPVPLIGVATDPRLVEQHGLIASRYEGPTGVVGVMLEACREIGIPAVSVWAAIPHYLAANPNPKAMLTLLDKASEILEIPIDTSELAAVSEDFEDRVDEAMSDNDDFVDYVHRLEEQGEDTAPIDPAHSDHLISEIEDFLKER
jgi:proteasome assembly chaperone (PAC2) family protein